MNKLVVTIDADGYGIMDGAAKFAGLPISLWARMVLLEEARKIKHRIMCQPKNGGSKYVWNGKPCTKEEHEEFLKEEEKTLKIYNADKRWK